MADYSRKLRELLRQHGCYLIRQGRGDHEIWFSPIVNRPFTVDGSIKKRHMANAVLKQAGIDKFF